MISNNVKRLLVGLTYDLKNLIPAMLDFELEEVAKGGCYTFDDLKTIEFKQIKGSIVQLISIS